MADPFELFNVQDAMDTGVGLGLEAYSQLLPGLQQPEAPQIQAPLPPSDATSVQEQVADQKLQVVQDQKAAAIDEAATFVETQDPSFKQMLAAGLPFLAMVATAKTQDQLQRAMMGFQDMMQKSAQYRQQEAARKQKHQYELANMKLTDLSGREDHLEQSQRDARLHTYSMERVGYQGQITSNIEQAKMEADMRKLGSEQANGLLRHLVQTGTDLTNTRIQTEAAFQTTQAEIDAAFRRLQEQHQGNKEIENLRLAFQGNESLQRMFLAQQEQMFRQVAEINKQRAANFQPLLPNPTTVQVASQWAGAVGAFQRAGVMHDGVKFVQMPPQTKSRTDELRADPGLATYEDYISGDLAPVHGEQFKAAEHAQLEANGGDLPAAQRDVLEGWLQDTFRNPNMEAAQPEPELRKQEVALAADKMLKERFNGGPIPQNLIDILEEWKRQQPPGSALFSLFQQMREPGAAMTPGAPQRVEPPGLLTSIFNGQ